jgi:hypothetical protein
MYSKDELYTYGLATYLELLIARNSFGIQVEKTLAFSADVSRRIIPFLLGISV